MIRTILLLSLLALIPLSQVAQASEARLSEEAARKIGLTALKIQYPDQYSDFVSKYQFLVKFSNGIWHVYGSLGKNILGGGGPVIEVRDRDEKVLKIYLVR